MNVTHIPHRGIQGHITAGFFELGVAERRVVDYLGADFEA